MILKILIATAARALINQFNLVIFVSDAREVKNEWHRRVPQRKRWRKWFEKIMGFMFFKNCQPFFPRKSRNGWNRWKPTDATKSYSKWNYAFEIRSCIDGGCRKILQSLSQFTNLESPKVLWKKYQWASLCTSKHPFVILLELQYCTVLLLWSIIKGQFIRLFEKKILQAKKAYFWSKKHILHYCFHK